MKQTDIHMYRAIAYLALKVSSDSVLTEASKPISDANSCIISVRKFASLDSLLFTSISKPDFPDEATKASKVIAFLRSSKA